MRASSYSVKFRHQLNIGLLALAFFLILATSAFSVYSTNALANSIAQVSHTLKVQLLISDMQVALGLVESAGLRYMISGDSEREMQHRHALADLNKLDVQFAQLTEDNPVQVANLAEFSSRLDALEVRSNESLAMKREAMKVGDELGPIRRISQKASTSFIGELSKVLRDMNDEENRLMLERAAARDSLVNQSNATVLIANALALVAGMLGFMAIRRSQRESETMLLVRIQGEHARRASEEKSSFLANMSHEIRTPMNAIFGFTQLLSDSVSAPAEREWVSSIQKSGKLLLDLINDVLDLSKVEAGKLQLHLQPTDLRAVVNETIELFMPLANEKQIFLTQEMDVASNEFLLLDTQRLRQVLINLLSNAVKYTEHGGIVLRIMISPSHDTDLRDLRDLRFFITDSGVGIKPEQIEEIFEPFHQAESPDGKVRQGTGLGLSISRRLVNMMKGDLQVTSDIGKGSTFVVEIFNVQVVDALPGSGDFHPARADFNKLPALKILVIDDVVWNTEIAAGFLGNSHHQIFIANSGLEGVIAAQAHKPDLVLMDLRMHGMNGFEATDAIRSDPSLQEKRIAIIAVTASGLGTDEKALRESFDGYVHKPYTPIELFDAIQSVFCPPVTLNESAMSPQIWTRQLQLRWHALHGDSLTQLRNSMRIREIGGYAQKLHQLASEAQFERLRLHAMALQKAVQQFNITAVTTALTELAGWPEEFHDA